jgi:AbrB family looped-hinge helix DNA binding protein
MDEYVTIVTRKGQITLPAAVRRALGVERGDRLSVRVAHGAAIIKPAESVVARTAGVVRTQHLPRSAEELRDLAEEAWAQEAEEEGR